jgi:hypothetical protein
LVIIAATLALAFLTMEASFIFGGIFGIFLLLALTAQFWRSEWPVGERSEIPGRRRFSFRILMGVALPALAVGLGLLMFKQSIPGLIVAGFGAALAILAVVLVILAWRRDLHAFAELDLIVLLGTLVLPFTAAIILKALGWEISQFNPGRNPPWCGRKRSCCWCSSSPAR